MKPIAFEYHRPVTVDEALELLQRFGGDAKPLAGGQSLIPAMNFRLAAPAVLVDLNAIEELAFIRHAADGVHLGAMTRHRALENSDVIARHAPLVHETMPSVAHAAIRTRGTLGGSLAHADPAAELPAVLLALEAHLTLRSTAGERTVAARDFFTGLFSTALDAGELVTAARIPPAAPRTGVAFAEISRRSGDFALAGAAASVTLDADGRCTAARVALFGVGDRPVLAARVARALEHERPSPEAIRAGAEEAAAHDIDPTSDIHASSAYRRQLARVLTRRVVERALARAIKVEWVE